MKQSVRTEASSTGGHDRLLPAHSDATGSNGTHHARRAAQHATGLGLSRPPGPAATAQRVPTCNLAAGTGTGTGTDADVAIEHWEDLFNSVKFRLRSTVDVHLAALTLPLAELAAVQVRTRILECVSALDQLHLTFTHEADRCQRLELELFEASSALTQSSSELAGTRAEELRARHLAFHDGLTLLPNRSFFHERFTQALLRSEANARTLAVFYIDLDGFKPINDAHGHEAGDQLLKIVAARLTRAVRAADMASRIGGDEFACLIGGKPTRVQLCDLAHKLVGAISAPVQIGEVSLQVRPSIGIATYPTDGTANGLLKNADAAMYRAKREQTGFAFFDGATNESKVETL